MKDTVPFALVSLGALALGCASTPGAESPAGAESSAAADRGPLGAETVRVYPRWSGGSRGSETWPTSNWNYYLTVAEAEDGSYALRVCSSFVATGSRIERDSCSRKNQSAVSSWMLSFNEAAEQIVARAISRQLEAGTLDLDARPLFVDVTSEVLEALNLDLPRLEL